MSKLRNLAGKAVFWGLWPVAFLYVRGTTRTRVLIEANGQVLLIKGWHDSRKWALPGGGIHKSEDPVLSAIREVAEEVGIYLHSGQMVNLGQDYYKKNGLSFKLQRYGCKLELQPDTQKQHVEILALGWFPVNDITKDMVDGHTWRQLEAWKQHS